MRLVNAVKYFMGRRHARAGEHRQSLVGFSFLLDYLPRWKYAYKPRGFIQFQSFVPKETALATFQAQMSLSKLHGIEPFLGVLKRHQAEPDFLLSHAVDGYSLALDFPLPRGGLKAIQVLTGAMEEVVQKAGGRFYLAKDSTLTPRAYRSSLPNEELLEFEGLRQRLDPDQVFQSDLSHRLELGPVGTAATGT
jgi:decaprenylphospho-beta-D-ribofuranose 2-oxidase